MENYQLQITENNILRILNIVKGSAVSIVRGLGTIAILNLPYFPIFCAVARATSIFWLPNVVQIDYHNYPDVIVSCDPEDLNACKFIQHPTLIAEVHKLSLKPNNPCKKNRPLSEKTKDDRVS